MIISPKTSNISIVDICLSISMVKRHNKIIVANPPPLGSPFTSVSQSTNNYSKIVKFDKPVAREGAPITM